MKNLIIIVVSSLVIAVSSFSVSAGDGSNTPVIPVKTGGKCGHKSIDRPDWWPIKNGQYMPVAYEYVQNRKKIKVWVLSRNGKRALQIEGECQRNIASKSEARAWLKAQGYKKYVSHGEEPGGASGKYKTTDVGAVKLPQRLIQQ